jgi:cytosine/adenosine deaminase-related metal-dependent hydrolase
MGSILKDQTIYIEGNSIKSISRRPVKIPAALIYDCSGKYLLPGLWDMHIHDAGDDNMQACPTCKFFKPPPSILPDFYIKKMSWAL